MKIKVKQNKKDTTDDSELDNEFNWIICSEKGLPDRMVFKNYKTHKTYGDYTIKPIPTKLQKLLQEYITSSKLKTGNFLFHQGKYKNKNYSESNFSTLISKDIFQLYTATYDEDGNVVEAGKRISVNILRHSYISHILSNTKFSYKQKEKIALAMGTSVDQMDTVYNKIEADEDLYNKD